HFAVLAAAAAVLTACGDNHSKVDEVTARSEGTPSVGTPPAAPMGPATMQGNATGQMRGQSGAKEGNPSDAPLSGGTPTPGGAGPTPGNEDEGTVPAAPARCTELATNPVHGLAGNASVKSATSQIVAAAGGTPPFCQVDILFGTKPEQNINIRLGLPLNDLDGGMGGEQGA